MKTYFLLFLTIILFSCNKSVTTEDAKEFKIKIFELNKFNVKASQLFVDEANKVEKQLKVNPEYVVDFEKLIKLNSNAIEKNEYAISQLANMTEIDKEINYKNSHQEYLISMRDLLNIFKERFESLQKSRDTKTNELCKRRVFLKLKSMKQKQKQLKETESEFNKKYKL